MYSVSIGDNFKIPELTAYDYVNDDILVTIEHNLNLNVLGEYLVTYAATNEIGTTTKTITVFVVTAGGQPIITLNNQIPDTVFVGDTFILPDATAVDYKGTPIPVIKSEEEIIMYYEGTYLIEYYAIDLEGNIKVLQFVIEFIEDPDKETLPVEIEEYYQTALNLSGTTLQNALYQILLNRTLLKYNQTSDPLSYIDRDLNDPTKVYLIYNGAKVNYAWDGGKTWNKEHVWAKSLFGLADMSNTHVGMGSDMHNLRACNPKINSTRNNNIFTTGSGEARLISGDWYPGDDHIGDVARIILYMYVAWNYEINVGDFNMFLLWHQQDPVDDFERARNNKIYEYQQNRNPFIDKPEFVTDIWGESTLLSNNKEVIVYYITVTPYIENKKELQFMM